MSGAEFAAIALAILVASCLQASIGFGLGLFAAPIIALVEPRVLPGVIVLLATVVTIIVAVRERASVDLRSAGWALVGRLPGTVGGALLVAALPATGLALVVAGTVLLAVTSSFLGWRPRPTRGTLVVAGATSGLMGTATAIGGPPMALVWQGSQGPVLRATMSTFFLVGSIMSLVALVAVGAIDGRTLRLALALAPAMLLGYVLSRWVNRRLNQTRLRVAALAMSAAGAVVIVAQVVPGLP